LLWNGRTKSKKTGGLPLWCFCFFCGELKSWSISVTFKAI
jgi:hypothetical protein